MKVKAAEHLPPAAQAEDIEALKREVAELRAEIARLATQLAEAEDLADRDALTPLLNRRAFVRELARAQAFAGRYGGPLSLAYFDLVGLKAINDRFGHAAGDAVLRATAERLVRHVRASDIVGRLGGDEFAVILARTSGFQAETKAGALAQAVAAEPIEGFSAAVRPQVSWGVAELRADMDCEQAIAEADAAMYAARRARQG